MKQSTYFWDTDVLKDGLILLGISTLSSLSPYFPQKYFFRICEFECFFDPAYALKSHDVENWNEILHKKFVRVLRLTITTFCKDESITDKQIRSQVLKKLCFALRRNIKNLARQAMLQYAPESVGAMCIDYICLQGIKFLKTTDLSFRAFIHSLNAISADTAQIRSSTLKKFVLTLWEYYIYNKPPASPRPPFTALVLYVQYIVMIVILIMYQFVRHESRCRENCIDHRRCQI